MNCKFCNAELEEQSMICPACGKDNTAEETELLTGEETVAEAVEQTEQTVCEETAEEIVEVEAETEPAEEKGCGSMISLSILALIPAAVLIIKKKED